jgi:hypothetical protein
MEPSLMALDGELESRRELLTLPRLLREAEPEVMKD